MFRNLRGLIPLRYVGCNGNNKQNSLVSDRSSSLTDFLSLHSRSAEQANLPGRRQLSVDLKAANPKLLDAMSLHRSGGFRRETYRTFLEELVKSILLVATPNGPPVRRPQLHDCATEVEISVIIGRSNDGTRKILCVFTDEAEFLRANPPCGAYHEMHATDLVGFAQRLGVDQIIINNASATAIAVDSSYFTALSVGKLPDLQ